MTSSKQIEFDLKKNIAKAELYMTEIRELHTLSQYVSDPQVKTAFLTRVARVSSYVDEISNIVDVINDLNFKLDENFEPDYTILREVRELHSAIVEAERSVECPRERVKETACSSPPGFRLPKIRLPEFSGNLSEWPMFHEQFRTLIHENPSLDNTAKLHYLLGSLKGRAAEVCTGILPSPANYEVLYNTLLAKYNNKRILAENYFRQMTDTKPLTQESSTALSHLLCQFDGAYKSLLQLSLPDLHDFFAGSLLLNRLDPQTRRAFETNEHETIPSYDEIVKFIYRQIEALSQVPKSRPIAANKFSSNNNPNFYPKPKTFVSQVPTTSRQNSEQTRPLQNCPICKDTHHAFQCEKFSNLTAAKRRELVEAKKLCANCLSSRHSLSACKSLHKCKFCQRPHHSLLHETPITTPASTTETKEFCGVNRMQTESTITLLSTAQVLVRTSTGEQSARFLIDSASQSNFITARCCRRLGLSFENQKRSISGIGSVNQATLGHTKLTIRSKYNPNIKFDISALVIDKITEQLPTVPIQTKQLKHLQNLPLADKDFFKPGPVEGILGADVFVQIIGSDKRSGPPHSPLALETKLGYIVMGRATTDFDFQKSNVEITSTSAFCSFENINKALEKFWTIEEVPSIPLPTDEDLTCEDLFQKTTTRNKDGRYCVHLPFKTFPPDLGDSITIAEKRFLSLERQFKKSPNFQTQYAAVIADYIAQGHMSKVDNDSSTGSHANYLPHFAIVKESSSTPLRIVFDASAKTSNSRSLNNTLFTGPKLHQDIARILTAFRISALAFIADIRQMYRNIEVTPEHRPFQRILWRENPTDAFSILELNCVVFGLTSAPYLALRTVQQLSIDERDKFPLAFNLLQKGIYVDDVVNSLDSPREVLQAYKELVGLFKAGGLRLTKWVTNCSELLEEIPPEDRVKPAKDFVESSDPFITTKVLGLKWDAKSDNFLFNIKTPTSSFTKRGVLSTIAKIWDPLGFLSPVTLYAKLIRKEFWMNNIGWDDVIPTPLREKWSTFISEISFLSALQIPRHLGTRKNDTVSLIGFADSSESGYGAVVYSRMFIESHCRVTLLCAKSKVAPSKSCSLPRLELCAALLLTKLIEFCRDSICQNLVIDSTYAFTDSTVTLTWIKNPPYRWKTFIANRVAQIQNRTRPEEWFHVPSAENIADIISRGLTPAQLAQHPHWISGPTWLMQPVDTWPIQNPPNATLPDDILEIKKPVTFCVTRLEDEDWLEDFVKRFSSLKKLLRVTVYIYRFAKKLPRTPMVTASDIEFAEHVLIRQVQRKYFREEFSNLTKQNMTSSKLKVLTPFIENEIIRVGGRLANSALTYNAKHPILLPKSSHLTHLIIDDCHRSNLHTGPTLVLALLRQKYWILAARTLVRKIIKNCNFCFKFRPQPIYPLMADLPAVRVQEAKPFAHTGVDYAGPFQISLSRRRGMKTQKAYVCLFVCLAVKAVHLELASDLSTASFLNCFKRFLARRGSVRCMYSDRGTNFIGAKAKLNEIYSLLKDNDFQNSLNTYLTHQQIQWKFNPPAAPHFGGIWEGNVRSVKTHLSKSLGTQILTYEEMYTLLTQIEALLNSRPLSALRDDPAEPEALTPANFLTPSPLTEITAEPDNSGNLNLACRMNLINNLLHSFWKRWHLEYLTTLQKRMKWNTPAKPVVENTVVLIHQDNLPPLRWPLGIIEKLHPGADGVTRVATVRSGKKRYTRPLVKLCPLPSQ